MHYVIAGNYKTYWSLNGNVDEEENNHEEADTLIIRCPKLANDIMETNIVAVYSADTDVFLLLLSHSNKIICQKSLKSLVKRNIDIKSLGESLEKIHQEPYFLYTPSQVVTQQGSLKGRLSSSGFKYS